MYGRVDVAAVDSGSRSQIPFRRQRIRRLRQEFHKGIEAAHKFENYRSHGFRALGNGGTAKRLEGGINVVGFGDHRFEFGEIVDAFRS